MAFLFSIGNFLKEAIKTKILFIKIKKQQTKFAVFKFGLN